jgi:drug/metabolite transporter (DMT)-like permease
VRVTRAQLLTIFAVSWVNTTLPFLLISWGEVTVPSGLASVLNSTLPIFSVLLAGAVLHDEPVTPLRLAGVAVGFAGVVLLLSRDLASGGIMWSHLVGQAAIVLASVFYAIGAVAVRRTLRGVHSLTIGFWVLVWCAAETTVLSLIFSRPDPAHFHADTWAALAWLGVLGSGLAYVLAFYILEHWGAARYTLVAYMLPLVGLTLGAIFLSESLDWRILAGSALVISGVVLAGMRGRKAPSAPEPTSNDRLQAAPMET